MTAIVVRDGTAADVDALAAAFPAKDRDLYVRYATAAEADEIDLLVAERDGGLAGYATIAWASGYPPFAAAGIPEVVDLNVREAERRRGVAAAILDRAEARMAQRSVVGGIRVGLHAGYGPAQRLYVLRGYVPDAAGLTIDGVAPAEGSTIELDEAELALTLRLRR